ncbi:MAG TPA: hypothetical protein VE242_01145, partial [Chthoniobacterales bacterium]|nr:hypothetical protein [Chthoniobacterales bacterium]
NVYPAALIQGQTLPGVSSGQAIEKMERICRENLPSQFAFARKIQLIERRAIQDFAAASFILYDIYCMMLWLCAWARGESGIENNL